MSSSVAIMMSRVRRLVLPDETWVAGLRGVLRKISAEPTELLLGDGTAGSEYVRQAAVRLNLPCRLVPHPSSSATIPDQAVPDQSLMDAAKVVYVLHLRAGGNLHRLLNERLEQGRSGVVLVDLPNLQPQALRDELCTKGAITWQPTADEIQPFGCSNCTSPAEDHADERKPERWNVYRLHPFPPAEEWDFLTHSTRACPGPWPGDSFPQYVDSLLDARAEADHSALSTLMRIVSQKKLIGSGRTIRGGRPVVSFTAIPLSELPTFRRFRPHRVHWDFEPYGICLRKEWLRSRGARPVQYADESAWSQLSEQQRPFFQRARGESGIDWTVEQEWRVEGDLSLHDVPPTDVILFVPHFEAAKSLAAVTSWPITLWPAGCPERD